MADESVQFHSTAASEATPPMIYLINNALICANGGYAAASEREHFAHHMKGQVRALAGCRIPVYEG